MSEQPSTSRGKRRGSRSPEAKTMHLSPRDVSRSRSPSPGFFDCFLVESIWSKIHDGSVSLKHLEPVLETSLGERPTKVNCKLFYLYPEMVNRKSAPASRPFHSSVQLFGQLIAKLPENREVQMHVFIKLSPGAYIRENAHGRIRLVEWFRKEIRFYSTVLPTIISLQRNMPVVPNPVDCYENVFPECYGTRNIFNENDYNAELAENVDPGLIILKDLLEQGFKPINPRDPVTLEFVKRCVERLAVFHAVPYAIKILHPEKYAEIMNLAVEAVSIPEAWCVVVSHIEYILTKVVSMDDLKPHSERILAALNRSRDAALNRPKNDIWMGLVHGRYCTLNLMHSSSGIGSIRILDLQHTNIRHMLSDLIFFLITCASKEILSKENLDLLTKVYNDKFLQVLSDYQLPNYEQLKEDMSYEKMMEEFPEQFDKELLKSIQQLKFLSPRNKQESQLRTLATWPRYMIQEAETRLDQDMHKQKLKDVLLALIDLNFI